MTGRRFSNIPGPGGKPIKGEDLDYEILEEGWSRYNLEDGTVLKVRIAAAKIVRGLNDDGSTLMTPDGEPYYNIRFQVISAAEVPPELFIERS